MAGAAARRREHAAAGTERGRAARGDRRRRRERVDSEDDIAAELAVAAEGVELRGVGTGLRGGVALAVRAGDSDAVLLPLDAGGAVGIDDLAAALPDRE